MARRGQKQAAIEDLRAGKTASLRCHGNSMRPRIHSGARVTLEPCTAEECRVGDAVLCRVRGSIYVHKVTAIKGGKGHRQAQISNNSGHVNGWTKAVYGRVIPGGVENP